MKRSIIVLICILLLVSFVSAAELEVNFTTFKTYRNSDSMSNIQISKLKYEPYPVNPGEYVTVWIQAENIASEVTENAVFRLAPEYPFSLDSNENALRKFGRLIPEEPVVLEYKVRVDKDAVEGTNKLKLEYSIDGKDNHWLYKEFDIKLEDAQTDFDMVIQEISPDGEASIAIANVGKNVAYSVIVRIPEQPDFDVRGTDGQMVGNLENGDYTMVGFQIEQKRGQGNDLLVQIDYTDLLGERRSVTKDVNYPNEEFSFNGTFPNGMTRQDFTQRGMTTAAQASIYQKWWFWLIIIAGLYIIWKGISWMRERSLIKEEEEARKNKR